MVSEYILYAIIILLLIVQRWERRDLYNRIMSKNMTEYKGENNYSPISAHQKVLERWRKRNGGER